MLGVGGVADRRKERELPGAHEGGGTTGVARRPRPWRLGGRLAGKAGYAALAGLVAVLVLPPVGYLVWGVLHAGAPTSPGPLTLSTLKQTFASSEIVKPLLNTLMLSGVVSVIAVTLGLLMAFVVAQTDVPGTKLWDVLLGTPFYIAPVFMALALIALAGRPGYAQPVFHALGLGEGPNIYSFWGTVFVLVGTWTGYSFMYLAGAVRALNWDFQEAASVLGASKLRALWDVAGKMLAPTLLANVIMIFALVSEVFVVPDLLWRQGPTLAVDIFNDVTYEPTNLSDAAGKGLLLLVITGIGLIVYSRLARRAERYVAIGGKHRQQRPLRLGRLRWPVAVALGLYFVGVVIVPVFSLLIASLQRYINPSLSGLTFSNYVAAFTGSNVQPLKNSLVLMVVGSIALLVLAYTINYLVKFTRARFRNALFVGSTALVAVPGMALGVGMLYAYVRFPIYGTLWVLLIAYAARWMPQAVSMLRGSFLPLSGDLVDAARVLGARSGKRLRHVVFPLTRRAAVSAWMVVAILILGEVPVTVLLYTPSSEPLSMVIWNDLSGAGIPNGAAVFAVIITVAGIATRAFIGSRQGDSGMAGRTG